MKTFLEVVVFFIFVMSASSLSSIAAKAGTRQLIRDIQACKTNVSRALELLNDTKEEGPYLAALHVCGKAKRHDVAIDLFRKKPESESCRALAIAVCGKCGEYKEALKLLKGLPKNPSIQSFNAAIAACGHAHAWKDALAVLESMPSSLVSSFTCNAVLTALAKSKRGMEAYELFKKMKAHTTFPNPDRSTYDHVINALLRQGKVDTAYAVFLEMKQHPDTFPKNRTYEMLITGYSKRKKWEMAQALEQERQDGATVDAGDAKATSSQREVNYVFEFWDNKSMTKVGRGKYARWEFGTLSKDGNEFTIAVHPHRNPAKNGISILLLQNGVKLGYVIMINSASANTSTLLGVYVDPERRKHGYSKVFLALWLKLCLDAKIKPQTGIINKPLLALVLQHTFGCIPQEGAGVDAEISAGKEDGTIVLYSAAAKNLEGAFSPKDCKREGLEIIKSPTEPRGRKVKIGCSFAPPLGEEALHESTNAVLAGKAGDGKVSHQLTSHDVRRIFLGEKE